MKKNHLAFAIISAFLLPTSLLAQSVSGADSWAGFHVGATLGGAWGNANLRYTNANYFNTLGPTVLGNTMFSGRYRSAIAGASLGYNIPIKKFILGLDASAASSNLTRKQRNAYFPGIDYQRININFLSNITLDLGLPCKKALFYIGGGFAGANMKMTQTTSVENIRASSSAWLNGWVMKTGINYKLSPHLYTGVAYSFNRLTLSTHSISCANCGSGEGYGTPKVHGHANVQTVSVNLSYLFGKNP
ncbi:MAG: hypothetical protein COV52_02965 [Gammaproteobacteria bacterium CG11_big_fil_rev_8_21_14_0_20_46_22]|nr:MAG: hypothetical protein COW05_02095 [Gammaproteobacteria bacterium CG12_big_fil_rev_8_21_14_0_65_46_12]PIR11736.1 MAG: hypothetical protein COV52_02965 [Gammaproteobacteria bacterium CG11_big_fil_rev_8_21_14_0_20_46_22]